jgi:hypothetical protein
MKSLITENEKQRIRLMHINQKHKLLKEQDQFDDLLEIPPTDATIVKTPITATAADAPKTGTPEAKAFQDWLDANKVNWNPSVPDKNWKKLNKGKSYGVFGPKTLAAWTKFKDEYTKTLVK